MNSKLNKEIIKFGLPAIAENFLQMLVGIIDIFLVSRLGLSAVSGVSLASNIIVVFQAIFIALGAIVSGIVARQLAEKNNLLSHSIKSALKLTLYISGFIGLLCLVFSREMVELMGASSQTKNMASEYLFLVGSFIVFLGLATTFGSILRAYGDTKTPMYASLYANFINIGLSALAIFVLGWGVVGVALSAVIARFFSTGYLYIKLYKKDVCFGFRGLIKQRIDKELIKQALPATAERLVMRVGDLLIIVLIISFGDAIFAGNAIGESIMQFNFIPAFGMATATVVLVAKEYGTKSMTDKINALTWRIYFLTLVMVLVVALPLFIFSRGLSGMFTGDSQAISASQIVLFFSLLTVPFAVGTTNYTAALQGIGRARIPFYATTVGMFGLRLTLGYLFGHILGLGLEGVWMAVMADNFFRFIYLKLKFNRLINVQ